MVLVWYPKCSTCQRAKAWLDEHGVAYTLLSDFPSRMRLDDIARNTRSQIVSAKLEEDGTVVPLEK